jgi:hypothetical protein
MKRKTPIEMERAALAARIRSEASIWRLRWLNEYLPAAMEEFDRRITTGESTTLLVPDMNDFFNEAMKQIEAADEGDDEGGDLVPA